ncbi:GFA family protein [Jannaschia rubra]|uniref:CENP-V/GFA domain-containing protein n=1 Tax=Jannaschia rubra TaxID=282197 RepID=A0A0M6XTI6_9RHOB|nr:GFA family protein [Jannaschia rubra]CTQ33274.1 hypothetical protein JAN5088_02056 [Jannaschia rubra]SFF98256.1 Uncharacterized conserved protein [Jannaschia rubra]
MSGVLEGRCLCGAVTIVARGVQRDIGACHCAMCRRWTGSVFLAFTAEEVTATGEVTRHASSDFAERAFCPRCGSHLWMRDKDGSCDLMPGLFDGTSDWPLTSEIYADSAPAWCRLSGDHPRRTGAEYERDNPFVEGS